MDKAAITAFFIKFPLQYDVLYIIGSFTQE